MKKLLGSLLVVGGILVIHALPPLAVALLPFWLMALVVIATMVTLALVAFWAFMQLFQGGDN